MDEPFARARRDDARAALRRPPAIWSETRARRSSSSRTTCARRCASATASCSSRRTRAASARSSRSTAAPARHQQRRAGRARRRDHAAALSRRANDRRDGGAGHEAHRSIARLFFVGARRGLALSRASGRWSPVLLPSPLERRRLPLRRGYSTARCSRRLWVTLKRLLLGYLIGVAIGLPLGSDARSQSLRGHARRRSRSACRRCRACAGCRSRCCGSARPRARCSSWW